MVKRVFRRLAHPGRPSVRFLTLWASHRKLRPDPTLFLLFVLPARAGKCAWLPQRAAPRLRAFPMALHSGCAMGRYGAGGAGAFKRRRARAPKCGWCSSQAHFKRSFRTSGRRPRRSLERPAAGDGVQGPRRRGIEGAHMQRPDEVLGPGGGLLARALGSWWDRLCALWA